MKSTKDNKEMVRRIMDAIWYQGNLAVFDECFASDFVGHSPDIIERPESVKPFVSAMRNSAHEIQIED